MYFCFKYYSISVETCSPPLQGHLLHKRAWERHARHFPAPAPVLSGGRVRPLRPPCTPSASGGASALPGARSGSPRLTRARLAPKDNGDTAKSYILQSKTKGMRRRASVVLLSDEWDLKKVTFFCNKYTCTVGRTVELFISSCGRQNIC